MEISITVDSPPSIRMAPIGVYMVENPLMVCTAALDNLIVHLLHFARQLNRIECDFSAAWTDFHKIFNVASARLDFQSKMKVLIVLLVPTKQIYASAASVSLKEINA